MGAAVGASVGRLVSFGCGESNVGKWVGGTGLGVRHTLSSQRFCLQSLFLRHNPPAEHFLQLSPPQSISVSFPFLRPSEQEANMRLLLKVGLNDGVVVVAVGALTGAFVTPTTTASED